MITSAFALYRHPTRTWGVPYIVRNEAQRHSTADSANERWKPPDLAPHLGVPGVWLQMELVRRKLYCAKKTHQNRL
ncbi:uncharacterized protein N7469_009744 [Penicillium citrinum]|uniref:Uncharacterized protein n=1 Tax=Penicillium citrinum TaxID=5077 RepID=A0A9W9NIY2_PENCI|nr:uncharacterized protein N7469_009744 [Penicillium citrinum]KAJ5220857.1 hypothetical protein N7469_009744 [Penicillium citrinum]